MSLLIHEKLDIPSNVRIHNKENFYNILYKLKQQGKNQLQVITDFDYTLSTFRRPDGTRNLSSHGVLENCNCFSNNYGTNARLLQKTYYPMEISTTLKEEEKKQKMDEWWNKAHELLIQEHITSEAIKTAVMDVSVSMREGSIDLIHTCIHNKIPMLVFSAGITDVLVAIFKYQLHINPEKSSGIEILSNKMVFTNDHLSGFENETITSLTKNMRGKSYVHRFEARHNLIVMGDNIGDLDMSLGMKYENRLTIGFLNDNIEDRIEQYMNSFDVVIVGDSDCKFVETIINYICTSHLDTIPQENDNTKEVIQLPIELG